MTVPSQVRPEPQPDPRPEPPPIVERVVTLAGCRTRALEVDGPGMTGPPILLLHGFTDSADSWRALLRELAARGRSAIAVDLPGHGRAAPPRAGGPLIPQLVEFAGAAVQWAGERPVVVGNSLGGMVALLLAAEEQVDITGVVPVSPAGFDYAAWMRLGSRSLQLPLAPLVLAAYGFLPRLMVETVIRRMITVLSGPRSSVDAAFPAVYARHLAGRSARRCMIGMLHRIAAEAIDVTLPLDAVRAPVMLVWGDRDPLTPPSGARILLDALPGVRHEVLERAGHLPQLQQPDRIAELLLDFAPGTSWSVAPAG